MNILTLAERKRQGEKVVMVTCYDYTSARIVDQSAIDLILVGDSAAMVMHGHSTTLPIDTGMMAWHVAAVRRGAPGKFIVGDLPFLSYRQSLAATVDAAGQLMRAGAEAVLVTTAKDWGRVAALVPPEVVLLRLEMRMEIEGIERLLEPVLG